MSVYTLVNADQLEAFLCRYNIGSLICHQGISAGITNTNYQVETTAGEFILTLYEHHSNCALDYILGLQHHLADKQVACAAPVVDSEGFLYSPLNQRSAAMINRVPGTISKTPTALECALIGAELARFHLAGSDYGAKRNNPCGLDWYVLMAKKLDPILNDADRQLLHEEIETYLQYPFTSLPQGSIHADLFHDNALFDGNQLGGIIDFDYACYGTLIYDLAVIMNDWCLLDDGQLDPVRIDSLLQAYRQLRPLNEAEHNALPLMLRVGALRFWLSRLNDLNFPLSGELTFTKDPDEFRDMLVLRRDSLSLSA
jgi:homoserine kinase type II